MGRADATQLLRENLLADSAVLVAGTDRAPGDAGAEEGGSRSGAFAAAVSELCAGLGARVGACAPSAYAGEDAELELRVERALGALGPLDVLVIDAASLFDAAGEAARALSGAQSGEGGQAHERAMLVGSLQASWNITHAVANRAFLAQRRPGRIVYLAPAPDAGRHAEAARAGLENLARTLSIEWARHMLTPVAIAPGERTAPGEVAALTAYLASPAGAYFSGCQLDLRGPRAG
jgi:NAD(P)-dependent dehydrogenase (short-subunit alcohol dehydrogenase family)